jgi:uncharacterized protein with HEPN domain
MSPRDWDLRIDDIIDALQVIASYVDGITYDQWTNDRKTIDAVLRKIEIIGEAAIHIPEDIQSRYPDIPWAQMRGIMNLLIHEYFGVDTDIIWQTITDDLPDLLKKITAVRYTSNGRQ